MSRKPIFNNELLFERIEEKLNNDGDIIMEDNTWITCYEPWTGTYFHTSPSLLMWAEMQLNKEYHKKGVVSFGYFLRLLGLSIADGHDHVGWIGEDGMKWIEIFNHHVIRDHVHPAEDPLAEQEYYELFYIQEPVDLED